MKPIWARLKSAAVKWPLPKQLAYRFDRTTTAHAIAIQELVARLSPSKTNRENSKSALASRTRFSLG
jgi:hypothetical protein